MTTRSAAVAGMFYPERADVLRSVLDRLLTGAVIEETVPAAAGYVVPHAGYRYSGPVAAHAYARIRRHAARSDRFVLLGPAHRVPLAGCAATGHSGWATPLGEARVDVDLVAELTRAGHVTVAEAAHAMEHSLEVQVPMLQAAVGPEVTIVPICVGRCDPDRVARLIVAAGGGTEGTTVVCSTDLSHYLPEREARTRDERTAAAILELSASGIGDRDACGSHALRGTLRWARSDGRFRPVRLAQATSADTSGDPERVVGYAAFGLYHRSAVRGERSPDRATGAEEPV